LASLATVCGGLRALDQLTASHNADQQATILGLYHSNVAGGGGKRIADPGRKPEEFLRDLEVNDTALLAATRLVPGTKGKENHGGGGSFNRGRDYWARDIQGRARSRSRSRSPRRGVTTSAPSGSGKRP
jgi:hypothetical protein